MFTDFLPNGYEQPRTQGNYLKLQDGDNKIRILSKPIIGWEDWYQMTPIRYRMDAKPDRPKDPKKPIKHFWSCIAWNYNEEKIQIFHITQATIITQITSLIKDKDWGSPFGYDLKINKTGQEKLTKYMVMPLPHKPCSQQIMDEYKAKPCLIDMMFDNQDPFGNWGKVTEGHFNVDEPSVMKPKTITEDQYKNIMGLIYDDKEYLDLLNINVKKHFGASDLRQLPSDKYEAILKSVKLYAKEKAEKEMKNNNNDLPF